MNIYHDYIYVFEYKQNNLSVSSERNYMEIVQNAPLICSLSHSFEWIKTLCLYTIQYYSTVRKDLVMQFSCT